MRVIDWNSEGVPGTEQANPYILFALDNDYPPFTVARVFRDPEIVKADTGSGETHVPSRVTGYKRMRTEVVNRARIIFQMTEQQRRAAYGTPISQMTQEERRAAATESLE